MSAALRPRGRDVPLKIKGTSKYIKGVNHHTTIGDVIKMVLRKSQVGKENDMRDSYGIFESSRGIERLLPGKGNVMKIMRSWGSSGDFEFVFRKVNPVVSAPKVSEAKRRKLDQRPRDGNSAANQHKYAKPAVLAELIHSQKLKLDKLHPRTGSEFVKEIYFNEREDSMDEFISNVDRQKLSNFLDFCGSVTSHEINRLSSAGKRRISCTNTNIKQRHVLGQSRRDDSNSLVSTNNVTMTSKVNHIKYAVRKTLKPKTVTVAPMTTQPTSKATNIPCTQQTDAVVSESTSIVHSTPSQCKPKKASEPRQRHERLASAITNKISQMNQREGKEALLRKYFNDYITYQSPGSRARDSRLRGRGDGAETEVGSMRRGLGDGSEQSPAYRKYNTRSAKVVNDGDSDSGQEDDTCVSNFDVAFIEEIDTLEDNNISGICRLVDYSLSESDQSHVEAPLNNSVASDVTDGTDSDVNTETGSNVSSVSDIVRNVFSERGEDEDEDMESFMKTRLDDFSDEGLSSLGSDDEREILV